MEMRCNVARSFQYGCPHHEKLIIVTAFPEQAQSMVSRFLPVCRMYFDLMFLLW
jgi:hypothetical protein